MVVGNDDIMMDENRNYQPSIMPSIYYICMGGYIPYKDSTTIRNGESSLAKGVNRGNCVLRSMAQGDLCVLVEGANWQIAGNPWVLIFKCIGLTKSWG